MTSVSDEGELITTYLPFPQNGKGDYTDRLKLIQFPVDLALSLALDTNAFASIIQDGRWSWRRSEKAKKIQWMTTCGQVASMVVYAYSITALNHQDQPAKEMSHISGLPSSDSLPVPDTALLEARYERLDKVWDRVARPMIKSLSSVCGVDGLKIHAWGILEAILAPSASASNAEAEHKPTTASLDRLLSRFFIDGAASSSDIPTATQNEHIEAMAKEAVQPSEIPAWDAGWVVRRLDSILSLFQDMLTGIRGLSDEDKITWIQDSESNPVLPAAISRIWLHILRAVAQSREAGGYTSALSLITRHLLQVFSRDPSTYVPIASLTVDQKCKVDTDTLRFGVIGHLMASTINILRRDAFGATRIPRAEGADAVDMTIAQTAFGADGSGAATMAGGLLGQLLRTQVLSFPISSSALASFCSTLGKILDAGAIQGFSSKLLGDITNHLPWVFQDSEDAQLGVWRLLAQKWVEVIDLQTSTAASNTNTNHTGALLVSLLSCPFHGRDHTSTWHQRASSDDLAIWTTLLKVTVQRYRAKRVGSNLGVLESLAGHLGDFLVTDQDPDSKVLSTTITLSCLAAATSHITFVPLEAHHAAHFSINENFVPADFLGIVNRAIIDSYPYGQVSQWSSSNRSIESSSHLVSPAVGDLIASLREVVDRLPSEFVWPVLQNVRLGLCAWFADDERIVSDDLASVVSSSSYCDYWVVDWCTDNSLTRHTFPFFVQSPKPSLRAIYRPRPPPWTRLSPCSPSASRGLKARVCLKPSRTSGSHSRMSPSRPCRTRSVLSWNRYWLLCLVSSMSRA